MDIDKILVVTFTNAAAEMRERISDAISKELDNPESKEIRRQMNLLEKQV